MSGEMFALTVPATAAVEEDEVVVRAALDAVEGEALADGVFRRTVTVRSGEVPGPFPARLSLDGSTLVVRAAAEAVPDPAGVSGVVLRGAWLRSAPDGARLEGRLDGWDLQRVERAAAQRATSEPAALSVNEAWRRQRTRVGITEGGRPGW